MPIVEASPVTSMARTASGSFLSPDVYTLFSFDLFFSFLSFFLVFLYVYGLDIVLLGVYDVTSVHLLTVFWAGQSTLLVSYHMPQG